VLKIKMVGLAGESGKMTRHAHFYKPGNKIQPCLSHGSDGFRFVAPILL
jgi:hypothetical protein